MQFQFSVFCEPTHNFPGLSNSPDTAYKKGDLTKVLNKIPKQEHANYLKKCLYEAILYHSTIAINDILEYKDSFNMNEPIQDPGQPLKFISLIPLIQNVFSEDLIRSKWDFIGNKDVEDYDKEIKDVEDWYKGIKDLNRDCLTLTYYGHCKIIDKLLNAGLNPYNECEAKYSAVDLAKNLTKHEKYFTCDFNKPCFDISSWEESYGYQLLFRTNLNDLNQIFTPLTPLILYRIDSIFDKIKEHINTHPNLKDQHAKMVRRFSSQHQSTSSEKQPSKTNQELDAEITRLKKELELEKLKQELAALHSKDTTPAYTQAQTTAKPTIPNSQDEISEKENLIISAENGNVKAKFELGCLYEKEGNIPKALKWYTQAAQSNHVKAQAALVRLDNSKHELNPM